MPTYIKAGYWRKLAKSFEGWLNLDELIQSLSPPSAITADELSAIQSANAPDASNPFATIGDIPTEAGGITDVTYMELATLIGASGLTEGGLYCITDFATKHYILDGIGDICLDGSSVPYTNTGVTEPIIVTAISVNELSPVAYSTLYPQDILHYDWNPDNWIKDLAISAFNDAVISGFKGVIFYREDTKNQNILGYDFRTVKNRRWKWNYATWSDATTYAIGTIVQVAADGAYASLQAGNLNNAVSDTAWWVKIIDYTTYGEYWCYDESIALDVTDFVDLLTFAEGAGNATYEKQVKWNTFAQNKDNTVDWWGSVSHIHNIVFYLMDEPYCALSSNTIGNNFKSNTIGSDFNNNTIGNYFSFNTIGNNFKSNTIGSDFYYNTIGNDFCYNTIGNYFARNTIGDYFIGNTVGYNFQSNNIGNYFGEYQVSGLIYRGGNIIENDIYYLLIPSKTSGTGFQSNLIRSSVQGTSGAKLDFTTATHVFADYNCEIMKSSTGTIKLKYLDGTDDTEKIVAYNA